jgi:opacity protein-like surface antigen
MRLIRTPIRRSLLATARSAGLSAALSVALGGILVAATAGTARAQDGVAPFSAFYGNIGTMLFDVSKLNARFERPDLKLLTPPRTTGFDAISNDAVGYGIGGYGPIGRLLLVGDFQYADVGEEASPSGRTNRLETTYLMATAGYALFTGWKFTLYPYLGIGAGQVSLSLKSRDGGPTVSTSSNPTFDEVVLSPGQSSTIKGSYILVQPGLGFDYLLLRSQKDRLGLTLGIRFSTNLSPNRTTWKYQGREVYGGPDVGPVGTSFRLVFGIGGYRLGK